MDDPNDPIEFARKLLFFVVLLILIGLAWPIVTFVISVLLLPFVILFGAF